MEAQFLRQNDLQRRATMDSLSRQFNEMKQSSGEKDLDFMMRDGKMLAEPQLLNKSVNFDQVKQVLAEYEMQFHIKELENGEKELHFFAKDANVCANALDKAMEDISKNPEKRLHLALNLKLKFLSKKKLRKLKQNKLKNKKYKKLIKQLKAIKIQLLVVEQ